MSIPDAAVLPPKGDVFARWAMVGILFLIAAGYFVFLYALYCRVSETDGYIQEFVEESIRRNVPGSVVPDAPPTEG